MRAAQELAPSVGKAMACRALGLARATFYRHTSPGPEKPDRPSPQSLSPRRLKDLERDEVLAVLHSPRFVDKAPAQVYAALLDEGSYLCSERTMYRLLDDAIEVRERRDQLRHPPAPRPELVATAPNQVWSWDITKLRGPQRGLLFYLYVILDIFSRYVVGWMLARRESAALAQRLLREAFARERIEEGGLILHADRGPSMTSKEVSQLLADLGVERSHSRPRVSNDNPYSESQFKTLKYQPDFPERFDSYGHTLGFCRAFFPWYNHDHRHSGIAWLTPADVHYGRADKVLEARQRVLHAAYDAHPERFVNGPPSPRGLPREVWINPPTALYLTEERGESTLIS